MFFFFLDLLRLIGKSTAKSVYFYIISGEINAIKHHFRYLISIMCHVKKALDCIKTI